VHGERVVLPLEHKEVKVDPKLFDGYVGRYELAPNFTLTITHEDDHLFERATGQATFQIYPDSDRDHFLKVIDAQITFVTDDKGQATELILHQGGVDQRAKRIE
jgi:D-alanyl-D-alanine-carboxypeptidase/D-alanyl-D-alanine-endopeptidase